MAAKVEAVIFDWGGVLIDDPRPGLMRYCANAFDVPVEVYTEVHDKFLEEFQKGLVSEQTFWQRVCKELGRPQPKQNFLWGEAFRSAYSPRPEVFALASALRNKGYKTALLSNTEVPAMEFFHQLRYDMFDVLVFSCAEGAQKPERKIYEVTVEKLISRPEQAVLIDDKPQFIEGAQQAGLNGVIFKNLEQVKSDLAALGVKATTCC
jgi:putative hydrolase of the HAD superfamily